MFDSINRPNDEDTNTNTNTTRDISSTSNASSAMIKAGENEIIFSDDYDTSINTAGTISPPFGVTTITQIDSNNNINTITPQKEKQKQHPNSLNNTPITQPQIDTDGIFYAGASLDDVGNENGSEEEYSDHEEGKLCRKKANGHGHGHGEGHGLFSNPFARLDTFSLMRQQSSSEMRQHSIIEDYKQSCDCKDSNINTNERPIYQILPWVHQQVIRDKQKQKQK